MEMEKNNNMELPAEEISRSSENTDVFEFRNLRNCLPMINQKSGNISDHVQNIGKEVSRLMKIKTLMDLRKEYSQLSSESKMPERRHEVLKRMAFPCKVSEKQEKSNTVSSIFFSEGRFSEREKRMARFSEREKRMAKYCVQNTEECLLRAECRRNVLLLREKIRLRRVCYSRGLSLEHMDEPKRDPHHQMKSHLYTSVVNDIFKEKEKLQKEVDETARLIHFALLSAAVLTIVL